MKPKIYGYARVSSKDQCEARQMLSLAAFPVAAENIFLDKQSGRDFDRPRYRALFRQIRQGDVLVVESIDRLGRNYEEILEEWRSITREKRAHIVVMDMPLLDTRQKGKDLTGTFIADLVLQILSYVAETEREAIRKRQAEGIFAARQRGVRFGPPKKPVPQSFPLVRARWERGEITQRAAAREAGISPRTFARWCAERRETSVTD